MVDPGEVVEPAVVENVVVLGGVGVVVVGGSVPHLNSLTTITPGFSLSNLSKEG